MSNKTEDIRKLWDNSAVDYDKHMEQTNHFKAQAELINSLSGYIESPIIDLASGTGYLAELLLKKNCEVTLNDFSKEMIGLCKAKLQSFANASFIQNNAESLILDKKFKTVICCNLFYYLQDRGKAIEHWKKILESNGYIILFEEYPFQKPDTKLMAPYENKLMELIDPISLEDVKDYFKDFDLVREVKTSIDAKHDLYGFVFTL